MTTPSLRKPVSSRWGVRAALLAGALGLLGGDQLLLAECGDYVMIMGTSPAATHSGPMSSAGSHRGVVASRGSMDVAPWAVAELYRPWLANWGSPAFPTRQKSPCHSLACQQKDTIKAPPLAYSIRTFRHLPVEGAAHEGNDVNVATPFSRPSDQGVPAEGFRGRLEKPPRSWWSGA